MTTIRLRSITIAGPGTYDVIFETVDDQLLSFTFVVERKDRINVVILPQSFTDGLDPNVSPLLRQQVLEAILVFHRACAVELELRSVLEQRPLRGDLT
jgi:hypothetical protein